MIMEKTISQKAKEITLKQACFTPKNYQQEILGNSILVTSCWYEVSGGKYLKHVVDRK